MPEPITAERDLNGNTLHQSGVKLNNRGGAGFPWQLIEWKGVDPKTKLRFNEWGSRGGNGEEIQSQLTRSGVKRL